jgi:hypothetical protein
MLGLMYRRLEGDPTTIHQHSILDCISSVWACEGVSMKICIGDWRMVWCQNVSMYWLSKNDLTPKHKDIAKKCLRVSSSSCIGEELGKIAYTGCIDGGIKISSIVLVRKAFLPPILPISADQQDDKKLSKREKIRFKTYTSKLRCLSHDTRSLKILREAPFFLRNILGW